MGRTFTENDAVGNNVPLLGNTTPSTEEYSELNHPTTLTSSTATSSPNQYPTTIRVFSYNCWGLKYIAKYRNTRLVEIGRQIAALDPKPDIIGLQECWTQQDYLAIRELTNHFLPYGKYYWSGIWGGGLAILSRWPIEESNMVKYPLNGRPTAFFRGDWFVGKGVACAKLRIGPGRKDFAEVFCTHLHAPYESEPNDSYICHRTAQAWEIAKLMRGAAERGHLVIGLGDFNMVPLSLAHRIIESQAPVRDVWRVAHPNSSIGAAINPAEQARGYPVPTAEYNLQRNGATCDGVLNTWRWEKKDQKALEKGQDRVIDLRMEDPKAKRLDYVFFGGGEGMEDARTWRVEDVKVGMTMRHPTLLCSLSDHFSVEATITCLPSSNNPFSNGNSNGTTSSTNKQASTAIKPQTAHLSPDIYTDIKAMIAKYMLRERKQRRWRLGHFVGQVTIAIGCFVAIWFSPRNYVSFILILLSTLGLSAGVIDGLIGGLFVSGEIRALKEFEWEIENAIAVGQREKERTGEGEERWGLRGKVAAERFDVDGEGRSSLGVNGC